MARKNKRKKILTPEEAICAYCKQCSGGVQAEVEFCCVLDCHLWPYRNGIKNKELPVDHKIWDEDIEIED
jgi:hypothetical protein